MGAPWSTSRILMTNPQTNGNSKEKTLSSISRLSEISALGSQPGLLCMYNIVNPFTSYCVFNVESFFCYSEGFGIFKKGFICAQNV